MLDLLGLAFIDNGSRLLSFFLSFFSPLSPFPPPSLLLSLPNCNCNCLVLILAQDWLFWKKKFHGIRTFGLRCSKLASSCSEVWLRPWLFISPLTSLNKHVACLFTYKLPCVTTFADRGWRETLALSFEKKYQKPHKIHYLRHVSRKEDWKMFFPLSTIKKFHAEVVFVAWLRDCLSVFSRRHLKKVLKSSVILFAYFFNAIIVCICHCFRWM